MILSLGGEVMAQPPFVLFHSNMSENSMKFVARWAILSISTVKIIFIRKANESFDPFSEIFDIFLIVKFSGLELEPYLR